MIQLTCSIVTIAILTCLAVGVILNMRHESKEWNNGKCSCGKGFWVHFDMDSGGAHGYKCSEAACDRTTWQNWFRK